MFGGNDNVGAVRRIYTFRVSNDPMADGTYDVDLCDACKVERERMPDRAGMRRITVVRECPKYEGDCNDCLAANYDIDA